MSYDIFLGAREQHHICYLYHRNVKKVRDNDTLLHNTDYDAKFNAKVITEKDKQSEDLGGVIRVHNEMISIETYYKFETDVEKDDKVVMDGKIWIVVNTRIKYIEKNSEFSKNPSRITTITLQKGE